MRRKHIFESFSGAREGNFANEVISLRTAWLSWLLAGFVYILSTQRRLLFNEKFIPRHTRKRDCNRNWRLRLYNSRDEVWLWQYWKSGQPSAFFHPEKLKKMALMHPFLAASNTAMGVSLACSEEQRGVCEFIECRYLP